MKYVQIIQSLPDGPPFIGGAIATCENYSPNFSVQISIDGHTADTPAENLIIRGNTKEEAEASWTEMKMSYLPIIKLAVFLVVFRTNGKITKAFPLTTEENFDFGCASSDWEPWTWESFIEFILEFAKEENRPVLYVDEYEDSYKFTLTNSSLGERIGCCEKSCLVLLTELYKLSMEVLEKCGTQLE